MSPEAIPVGKYMHLTVEHYALHVLGHYSLNKRLPQTFQARPTTPAMPVTDTNYSAFATYPRTARKFCSTPSCLLFGMNKHYGTRTEHISDTCS